MATYDELTKSFMDEVLGNTDKEAFEKKESLSVGIEDLDKNPSEKTAAQEKPDGEVEGLPVLEIYRMLFDNFERDWIDWEPETLQIEIKEELGYEPNERMKNIIGAFQTTLKTNYPFELWHVFEKVCHAFNENPVSFAVIQPCEPHEISLTYKLLAEIRPKMHDYTDDVCGYIAACAQNAGLVFLPSELFPDKCQMFLNQMLEDKKLKEKVEEKWPNYISGESQLAIQTQMLKEVRDYAAKVGGFDA